MWLRKFWTIEIPYVTSTVLSLYMRDSIEYIILFENDGLGMQVGTSILVAFGLSPLPKKGFVRERERVSETKVEERLSVVT